MDKYPFTRPATCAPPIAILGVPFDNINTAETVTLVEQMVASKVPHYLATANVDFLVQALHDVELRRILMDAHLVVCDGTPLLWASKLLGNPLPERVAGSDLVPLLLQVAQRKKYRVFLLGATNESLQKAVANLKQSHPGLIVAGAYSPPFRPLHEMDHEEITCRIKQAKPDLLFVSFGCPKQEKWIAMHYRTLGVPVCIGVGATIDFLAGAVKRAPRWMQRSGTEWLFRMAQEPKRLCRRYGKDLAWFGQAIVRQWWHMHFDGQSVWKKRENKFGSEDRATTFRLLRMPATLDVRFVRMEALICEEALSNSRQCALLLDGVDFIDSSGMGLLIRLQKKARITGRQLVLLAPSAAVVTALKVMRLQDFFTIIRDRKEVETIMETNVIPKGAMEGASSTNGLAWKGEVTAANVDDVWNMTQAYIRSQPVQSAVKIDLSAVTFIDSTGLGLMIRARKLASQLGDTLLFIGAQPNVRNVLRIARLESSLLAAKA
jgi:N-acetylglucosaminyldiphosphoundecaprenol N-acetyl-beta-D-mannosaminyltransferase